MIRALSRLRRLWYRLPGRAKGMADKDIEHAKRCLSGRCFEAAVQAVPDQVAVLASV